MTKQVRDARAAVLDVLYHAAKQQAYTHDDVTYPHPSPSPMALAFMGAALRPERQGHHNRRK